MIPEESDGKKILSSYLNGGYEVTLFDEGTKIRKTIDERIGPVLPEQMDLKITDWCDGGCAWCHERSTPKGQHADVDAILKLLSVLPAGSEIAIGGGDPLSHPEFDRLVTRLSEQGLVCNVTVNGKHLDRHVDRLDVLTQSGFLHGVGISYAGEIPSWDYPHRVLHLITGIHPPSVLDEVNSRMKVLLLGYKQYGRGLSWVKKNEEDVSDCTASWYRELFIVAQKHHLSFDNLAIEQLKPKRLFINEEDYNKRYMGDEGQFSMYLDAVTQTFSRSSYSALSDRKKWREAGDSLEAMFAGL